MSFLKSYPSGTLGFGKREGERGREKGEEEGGRDGKRGVRSLGTCEGFFE